MLLEFENTEHYLVEFSTLAALKVSDLVLVFCQVVGSVLARFREGSDWQTVKIKQKPKFKTKTFEHNMDSEVLFFWILQLLSGTGLSAERFCLQFSVYELLKTYLCCFCKIKEWEGL